MAWRPLSLRNKPDKRFDEPSEGLPPWLRGPVLGWVRSSFIREDGFGTGANTQALGAAQLALRLDPPLTGMDGFQMVDGLLSRASGDEEFGLDLLDWMLQHWRQFRDAYDAAEWAGHLGAMLHQGGSAWEVTNSAEVFELTRRAVGPVLEVLEQTANEATRAHDLLRDAWSKLTGRNPDASGAYRESVRAVEAVAKPVILPNNARATLGQMIPAIRDKPQSGKPR